MSALNAPLVDMAIADYVAMLERQNKYLRKELHALEAEMKWLDAHCSFVADGEYNLGPFKVGELRELAQEGIEADRQKANVTP